MPNVDLRALNPVFIDIESTSTCDLKSRGGFNYAADPSTRLLTVSWSPEPDEYHVWFPYRTEPFAPDYTAVHLSDVTCHYGPAVPEIPADRPWVAHNAWTFDEPVWESQTEQKRNWLDSYPLALAAGLPGGLQQIAQRLWGEGKYEAGSKELAKWTRGTLPQDVPAGSLLLIARYNVQDVRLLRWLWEELTNTLHIPESEWRVMLASRACNSRGVHVDRGLLYALMEYTTACQETALLRIRELTDGYFETLEHLRSRTRVNKWLDGLGIKLGGSLRKEIVTQWIESVEDERRAVPEFDKEDDTTAKVNTENINLVSSVLQLRMSALRVTGGKLKAGLESVSADDRIRGLHAYWGAHTGRDAHRRMQIGNLPRPKDGVDVWKMIDLFEKTGGLDYEKVTALMPLGDPRFRWLTPDDASSAVLRMTLGSGTGSIGVADFSTIEARVIAWLAGEEWLCQAFRDDTDVYLRFGAFVVGPTDTWPDRGQKKIKKHPWRQVFKIVLLGSLYGLGPTKLTVYGAALGIDWKTSPVCPEEAILGFRSSHPAIAGQQAGVYEGAPYFRGGLWDQYNAASVAAVQTTGVPVSVGRITFVKAGPHLYVRLPSGRYLCYRHAEYVRRPFFGRLVDSVRFQSARYGLVEMYGGKWAENITQGVARDFMMYAAVLMEERGIPVVLRVHDELGAETDDLDAFMGCMTSLPPWADGFTLDAEGQILPRYAKSAPPGVKEVLYRNGGYYRDVD